MCNFSITIMHVCWFLMPKSEVMTHIFHLIAACGVWFTDTHGTFVVSFNDLLFYVNQLELQNRTFRALIRLRKCATPIRLICIWCVTTTKSLRLVWILLTPWVMGPTLALVNGGLFQSHNPNEFNLIMLWWLLFVSGYIILRCFNKCSLCVLTADSSAKLVWLKWLISLRTKPAWAVQIS